jgi:hypothetical protein
MRQHGKPFVVHAGPREKQLRRLRKKHDRLRTMRVERNAGNMTRSLRHNVRLSMKPDVQSGVLPRPVRKKTAGRLKRKKLRGKNANGRSALSASNVNVNVNRSLLMAIRQPKTRRPDGLPVVNGARLER